MLRSTRVALALALSCLPAVASAQRAGAPVFEVQVHGANTTSFTVREVQGLPSVGQPRPTREKERVPGGVRLRGRELTLTVPQRANNAWLSTWFSQWAQQAKANGDAAARQMTLILLRPDGTPAMTYEVDHVLPKQMSTTPLSGSNSDVMLVRITVTYRDVSRS